MIKENTNKTLAINSFILQSKLIVVLICGLLTTRFALQALGETNFGLFSVVGGVISFISIFNSIMLSASNRFIAVAIGKGDIREVNKQFNVNLIIHLFVAVCTLIIAFPLGDWYIYNYINYGGDIYDAILVYKITVIGSIISFIGVPYQGLLIAKENFLFFCLIDMLLSVVKLSFTFLLLYYFTAKLLVYALILSVTIGLPTLICIFYTYKKYNSFVTFELIKDFNLYREVVSFSVWTGVGAVASIVRSQGSSLIINTFFSTVMNVALGIANTISNILFQFSSVITQPMQPQIVKNFASGNLDRSLKLVILSSKVSYIIMLIISVPFIVEAEFLISLWLGEVPLYSVVFVKLLIVSELIRSFNAGIPSLVFATGRIKWYQIIESSLILLSVFFAYCILKSGAEAYYYQIIIIAFSVLILIVRHVLLNIIVKINTKDILIQSYLPLFLLTLAFSISLVFRIDFHPVVNIIVHLLYLVVLIWFAILKKDERTFVAHYLKLALLKIIKYMHVIKVFK